MQARCGSGEPNYAIKRDLRGNPRFMRVIIRRVGPLFWLLAPMKEQGKMCSRCGENPAQTESALSVIFLPFFLLFGIWSLGDSKDSNLCSDCAGGLGFLGLLAGIAVLIIGFVFVVIMFTH